MMKSANQHAIWSVVITGLVLAMSATLLQPANPSTVVPAVSATAVLNRWSTTDAAALRSRLKLVKPGMNMPHVLSILKPNSESLIFATGNAAYDEQTYLLSDGDLLVLFFEPGHTKGQILRFAKIESGD